MYDTTAIEIPTFRIGNVLSQSFALLCRNAAPLFTVFLIFNLPNIAFVIHRPEVLTTAAWDLDSVTIALTILFTALVPYVASGAVVFASLQGLAGERVSVGRSLRQLLPRLPSLVGVCVCVLIVVYVGYFALIVPGLFLGVVLWMAVPVILVERTDVLPSLGRSAELTKGHRWKILGLNLLLMTALIAVSLLFGPLVALSGDITTAVIGKSLIDVVVWTFFSAVSAVGYVTLRAVKDGLPVDQVAAVFD